jgi:hypothetical protein
MMETIKLKVHIGMDGLLKIQTPTNFKDIETEVVIVLQPQPTKAVDAMGYPIGYFEAIDAIIADDVMERGEQGMFEIREDFE